MDNHSYNESHYIQGKYQLIRDDEKIAKNEQANTFAFLKLNIGQKCESILECMLRNLSNSRSEVPNWIGRRRMSPKSIIVNINIMLPINGAFDQSISSLLFGIHKEFVARPCPEFNILTHHLQLLYNGTINDAMTMKCRWEKRHVNWNECRLHVKNQISNTWAYEDEN